MRYTCVCQSSTRTPVPVSVRHRPGPSIESRFRSGVRFISLFVVGLPHCACFLLTVIHRFTAFACLVAENVEQTAAEQGNIAI